MVWGLISCEGPIALCKVECNLNSDNFIENILKKCSIFLIKKLKIEFIKFKKIVQNSIHLKKL